MNPVSGGTRRDVLWFESTHPLSGGPGTALSRVPMGDISSLHPVNMKSSSQGKFELMIQKTWNHGEPQEFGDKIIVDLMTAIQQSSAVHGEPELSVGRGELSNR